ncbi:hypothetical protein, partial [Variovorax paradoxus]|uniref:hypothetical protein n=1 Tax=Variovorax paradoxus TaxID=34073 RepID=UPI003996A29E
MNERTERKKNEGQEENGGRERPRAGPLHGTRRDGSRMDQLPRPGPAAGSGLAAAVAARRSTVSE